MFDARQISGPYLAWTVAADSRLCQSVLRLALIAALTVAGALMAAAILEARAGVFATASVALLAAVAAWWQAAHAARPMQLQLQINANGEIRIRDGEKGAGEVVRAVYVSNWQVVLNSKNGPVAVWVDMLGADGFRRLVVLARWRLDRRGSPLADVENGGQGGGQDRGQGHWPIDQSTPAQSEAAN